MNNILLNLRKVRLFLFDLEGVLYLGEEDLSSFYTVDAEEKIKVLFETLSINGSMVGVITGRNKDEVTSFFDKKGFTLFASATLDKLGFVQKLIDKKKLKFENVFYIGDNLLDIPLLQKVGVSAAPKHARREVKRVVDFVCEGESALEIIVNINNLLVQSYKEGT
ncbi:MAG: HAD hydrolase family protein [Melioribacteraceae bacterium]|nr:HAD hydrolase family protein [Melioribacteraceae bacterium]